MINYLLRTPSTEIPDSLTHDLHRIDRLGVPLGQDALVEAARRRGLALVPAGEPAKTGARTLALHAFIAHPVIFEEAEVGIAFMAPPSVAEFVAAEEEIVADLSDERLRHLQERAREIYRADLREEFCEVTLYRDGGGDHVLIRHGAHLTIAEVVEQGQKAIRSYREMASAVLAYSAEEGRIKVWVAARRRGRLSPVPMPTSSRTALACSAAPQRAASARSNGWRPAAERSPSATRTSRALTRC